MAESGLKLLGRWSSPYAMRVKIALNIKSLGYEYFEETMNPKSDLLLQSNPVYGKIPVLIHHGKPICESLIIVEYIDEAWSSGPSILPSDAYDRVIARFWAAYIDDKWFPAMKSLGNARGEEERKALLQQLEEGSGLLEDAYKKISNGKPYFGGERIGYLDIAFGCFLGWTRVAEAFNGPKLLDPTMTPGLAQWAERFCADAAVKDVMPETGKLVEFAKILHSKMASSAAN